MTAERDHVGDGVHVGAEARHEVANAVAADLIVVEAQEVGIEVGAKQVGDAGSEAHGDLAHGLAKNRADKGGGEINAGHLKDEGAGEGSRQEFVDDMTQIAGEGEGEKGCQKGQEHRNQNLAEPGGAQADAENGAGRRFWHKGLSSCSTNAAL